MRFCVGRRWWRLHDIVRKTKRTFKTRWFCIGEMSPTIRTVDVDSKCMYFLVCGRLWKRLIYLQEGPPDLLAVQVMVTRLLYHDMGVFVVEGCGDAPTKFCMFVLGFQPRGEGGGGTGPE